MRIFKQVLCNWDEAAAFVLAKIDKGAIMVTV